MVSAYGAGGGGGGGGLVGTVWTLPTAKTRVPVWLLGVCHGECCFGHVENKCGAQQIEMLFSNLTGGK